MISFIGRTCIYVFILIQVATGIATLLLTTASLILLEATAYMRGQDDAMKSLIQIGKGDDLGN